MNTQIIVLVRLQQNGMFQKIGHMLSTSILTIYCKKKLFLAFTYIYLFIEKINACSQPKLASLQTFRTVMIYYTLYISICVQNSWSANFVLACLLSRGKFIHRSEIARSMFSEAWRHHLFRRNSFGTRLT